MNKIAVRVHFFNLLLLSIFGNRLLKISILGITNLPLILYFTFCLIHIILESKNKTIKLNDIEKKVLNYIKWYIIIILLSLTGIYRFFLSDAIEFNKSFIIKQTLFIFLIPIAISMYICFLNNEGYIEKTLKKYSLIIFCLMNILTIFKYCNQTVSYFFLLLLSFYIIKNNKKYINIIVLGLTVIYIRNIYSESTAFLMLLVYTTILMFDKRVLLFVQKRRKIIYSCIVVLLILVFTHVNDILTFLSQRDANYWWRFSYWINEFNILKKILFMGVGYGSTYASSSIFTTLHGGFIDPETGKSVNTSSALFTTAQHNSYMNILYRTGIVGIVYFLNYTSDLIFKSKKYIKNEFDSMLFLAFINANIIILFNVGLESPQFIIPYNMSLVGLMSLRRKILTFNIIKQ